MSLPAAAPVRNQLLAALPTEALDRVLPKLTPFALTMRLTLYGAGDTVRSVWFPESGMVSLVATLDDGMQAEVGIVGREGMLWDKVAEFRAGFGDRLVALARSHDLLIRGGWQDAPLREVIEGALAAHGGSDRVSLDGIAVLLPANLVVTMTLAFHELVTNAVKHGALSVPGGTVSVAWTRGPVLMGTRHVDIVWRERGGPPVQPPQRRGFGSHLLEQGIRAQSGGTLRLDYEPRGLECRISLPLGGGMAHG